MHKSRICQGMLAFTALVGTTHKCEWQTDGQTENWALYLSLFCRWHKTCRKFVSFLCKCVKTFSCKFCCCQAYRTIHHVMCISEVGERKFEDIMMIPLYNWLVGLCHSLWISFIVFDRMQGNLKSKCVRHTFLCSSVQYTVCGTEFSVLGHAFVF